MAMMGVIAALGRRDIGIPSAEGAKAVPAKVKIARVMATAAATRRRFTADPPIRADPPLDNHAGAV
jgi:hypothetical protein